MVVKGEVWGIFLGALWAKSWQNPWTSNQSLGWWLGFNPSEKYAMVKIGARNPKVWDQTFPQHSSCHHLVMLNFSSLPKTPTVCHQFSGYLFRNANQPARRPRANLRPRMGLVYSWNPAMGPRLF